MRDIFTQLSVRRVAGLWLGVVGFAVVCLYTGCTGGGSQNYTTNISGIGEVVRLNDTLVIPPSSASPLVELRKLAAPSGTDAKLWNKLTAEFEKQWKITKGDVYWNLASLKSSSTPPNRDKSQAILQLVKDEAQWGYCSQGDYDQNGEVNISDLTPIALHFGETAPPEGFPHNSIQAVVDGDGNGEINLSDITPIVINYQNTVQKYTVYVSENEADYPQSNTGSNGGATLSVKELSISLATGNPIEERLLFKTVVNTSYQEWYIWVRPSDGTHDGTASNMAGPYQPAVFSLDGYVFMAGGGTDPLPGVMVELNSDDPRSEVTDSSGRYRFEDLAAGDYIVTPTGDPYGYTPEFIVAEIIDRNVSLDPIYPAPVDIVHTWGLDLNSSETSREMAIDNEDNIYLVGHASSLDEPQTCIMKYDKFGNLLWTKTYQLGDQVGLSIPVVRKVLVDNSGQIYLCGSYQVALDDGLNIAYYDAFVIKLDNSGNEEWNFSYSSDPPPAVDEIQYHIDNLHGMQFDSQGNIVVGGTTVGKVGYPNYFLKLSPDGELLEEQHTICEQNPMGLSDLLVDSSGNIYTCSGLTASEFRHCQVMKINPSGHSIWINHWGDGLTHKVTNELRFGLDGSILALSVISPGIPTDYNFHLVSFTPQGDVNWEFQTDEYLTYDPQLAVDSHGMIWVCTTEEFRDEFGLRCYEPSLISFDPAGNFRFSRQWVLDRSVNMANINDFVINSHGVAVICGKSLSLQGTWENKEIVLVDPQYEQFTQISSPVEEEGLIDSISVIELGNEGEVDRGYGIYYDSIIMYYRP